MDEMRQSIVGGTFKKCVRIIANSLTPCELNAGSFYREDDIGNSVAWNGATILISGRIGGVKHTLWGEIGGECVGCSFAGSDVVENIAIYCEVEKKLVSIVADLVENRCFYRENTYKNDHKR